ncbi:MAG TPA: Hsp20/alpha crystallin family protein [Thermoanaerobaculia bacterium]|nr:Hsp20/alpha crystallin family protein [Thermoanaerobaculia bacterium]
MVTNAPITQTHALPALKPDNDGWLRLDETQTQTRPRPRRHVAIAEVLSAKPASFAGDRGFPKVEVLGSPALVLVRVALPGVQEGDLRIRLDESDLVIDGELRPPGGEAGCSVLLSDWSYGPFHRRIQLDVPIDPTAMRTELRDGLLRIEIDLLIEDRALQSRPVS